MFTMNHNHTHQHTHTHTTIANFVNGKEREIEESQLISFYNTNLKKSNGERVEILG